MASTIILGAFVVYLLAVLGIGVWGASETGNQEDYLLGGRGLNIVWATLSEQASLWSGWLTVGLPAFVYSSGMLGVWWFFWCIPGNLLAWGVVAKRLSRYSRMLKALTLPEFLGKRYDSRYQSVILLAAAGAAYFYFFYVAAQVLAGTSAIRNGLGFTKTTGFAITVVIVIGYTLAGGYLAVSLTDVMQGILMMIFAIAVPLATIAQFGGLDGLMTQYSAAASASAASWTAGLSGSELIVSSIFLVGFGLPFLAQPHGVVRYMSMKKPSQIGYGMMVMSIFQVLALIGVPILAFGGVLLFPDLANVDALAPKMIVETLPGWLAGILLAGIVAAVMSTADSQLLVVGSTIGEDAYKGVISPNASDRKVMMVTRAAVLVAGGIAAAIAWTTPDTVFTAIAFAWGGLGTTFMAPLVLGLWWDRANGAGAIAGLVVGFVGAGLFSQVLTGGPVIAGTGLFDRYFVLPVLIMSFGADIIVSLLTEPPSDQVSENIREVSRPLNEELSVVSGSSSPGPAATDGGFEEAPDTLTVPEESLVTEFVKGRSLDDLPSASST
ncbi:sodium/proline symporter [Haloarculaceae archaeon H-GB2-1]|nr:sodium/proline symporter [Haloarculaceae archaeon H-GB1-1]MEA5386422.1 sodium/proline symporter [Haloarculaceae archaeon H-GB11]MEA5407932.1 sodium/proline symporter [Haloarculaceae archaeon H-GB2-1]